MATKQQLAAVYRMIVQPRRKLSPAVLAVARRLGDIQKAREKSGNIIRNGRSQDEF